LAHNLDQPRLGERGETPLHRPVRAFPAHCENFPAGPRNARYLVSGFREGKEHDRFVAAEIGGPRVENFGHDPNAHSSCPVSLVAG
jgi:hypothetical protein